MSPPTVSCITPWPRPPSAWAHWHTAGLRLYASMHFPLWAFLQRHCARSGRMRNRSCWLHHIGPPGPGFQNSCSSWQPLPGAFLFFQRLGTFSTGVQITGRGRPNWFPTGGGRHYHSGQALSTRRAFALKWSLFTIWCSSRREDPRRCTIGVVFSFLQGRLERRLSPSTLKVYVAAIAAHHDADAVYGRSHRQVPEGCQKVKSS